jgi:isopentenyldiphosphate isomerase
MQTVGREMVIDEVDSQDRPIGTIVRRQVFSAKTGFRVAHVFVLNYQNELLLQRIAENRDRHPGYWGSSVAAYLFSGEDYASAALRRTRQELRIEKPILHLVGKTRMQDAGCAKFISLFTMTANGPFDYDRSHIAELQFQPLVRIQQMVRTREHHFTPTFVHLFAFYLETLRRH